MGTYYGYVKQDIESQVDWGAVGKTFTDMLSTESTRRETLKKEIDDNTVTDLERLAQIPKGSSEEYNKWTTDAADKISQARLLQVKELKAGRLSLKDYNNYRQNTVSGVNNMVATIKSYNAWFDNGMKRAEKMESGAAELWKDSLLESMKFKDTVPNIALDGSMSVTKQVKNPKTGLMEVSTNPADAFSFSSMLDFGKKQFNRFKASESLDGLSKTVGEFTKALNKGNVGTRSSIWQTDAAGKFMNPQIGAIQNQVRASIANPNDAMSVLVDFKGVTPSGGKYEFTNDPNDPKLKGANRENVIFMDSTMSPQLTEGQRKRAEDIMIEGLKARSSVVETAYTPPKPQEWELLRAEEKEAAKDAVKSWAKITSAGSVDAQEIAANAFLGTPAAKKNELLGIDFTTKPGRVLLTFQNSARDRDIPASNMTNSQWAKLGADITGVSSEKVISSVLGKRANDRAAYWADEEGNLMGKVKVSRKGAPVESLVDSASMLEKSATRSLPIELFKRQTNTDVSGRLAKALGAYGVTVTPNKKYAMNDVTLKYGDKSIVINTNEYEDGAINTQMDVINFLSQNIPKEKRDALLKQGKLKITYTADEEAAIKQGIKDNPGTSREEIIANLGL